jgi:arginine decarboxylase-like protein
MYDIICDSNATKERMRDIADVASALDLLQHAAIHDYFRFI